MTDADKQHIIESHYRGCLTDLEKVEFESLMANDPEFAAEAEDYSYIFEGLDMLHLSAFETKLQSWEQKHKTEKKPLSGNAIPNKVGQKSSFKIQRLLAIAAVLSGLAFLPLAYNLMFSSTDPYTALFEAPTAMSITVRGDEMPIAEQQKSKAYESYNTKNYEKAVIELNIYLSENKSDAEAVYFLGVSQMGLQKFSESIKSFDLVISTEKGSIKQSAEWMKVLSYYKLGDKALSVNLAKEIAGNTSHVYKDSANIFLKKVK